MENNVSIWKLKQEGEIKSLNRTYGDVIGEVGGRIFSLVYKGRMKRECVNTWKMV